MTPEQLSDAIGPLQMNQPTRALFDLLTAFAEGHTADNAAEIAATVKLLTALDRSSVDYADVFHAVDIFQAQYV